jgi:hypothetical protein
MNTEKLFAVGTLKDEAGETLVCYRQGVADADRCALSRQFIIEWEFSDAEPNGLPTEEELCRALELQSEMLSVLESKDESLLALIVTGNGFREWYFYCGNPEELQLKFNAAVQGKSFPVKIHAGYDPEWSVYRLFTDPLIKDKKDEGHGEGCGACP